MKKILILTFAIVVLFITSCNKKKSQYDNYKIEITKALEAAKHSKQIEDTIFLGFRFSMTENDAITHFKELEQNGKVRLNNKGIYEYDFRTPSGIFVSNFHLEFTNKKLSEFSLLFISEDDNDSPLSSNIDQIMGVFLEKKGFDMYVDTVLNKARYRFIKHNLIVEFYDMSTPRMSYINAPYLSMIDSTDNNTSSNSSSVNDL
jgi:hypothetical protein